MKDHLNFNSVAGLAHLLHSSSCKLSLRCMGKGETPQPNVEKKLIKHLKRHIRTQDCFFYESKMKKSPVVTEKLTTSRVVKLLRGVIALTDKNITGKSMERIMKQVCRPEWGVDPDPWSKTMSDRLRTAISQIQAALSRDAPPQWVKPYLSADAGGHIDVDEEDQSDGESTKGEADVDAEEEEEEEDEEEEEEESEADPLDQNVQSEDADPNRFDAQHDEVNTSPVVHTDGVSKKPAAASAGGSDGTCWFFEWDAQAQRPLRLRDAGSKPEPGVAFVKENSQPHDAIWGRWPDGMKHPVACKLVADWSAMQAASGSSAADKKSRAMAEFETNHKDGKRVTVSFRNNTPKNAKATRLVAIRHGAMQVTQASTAWWDESDDRAAEWAWALARKYAEGNMTKADAEKEKEDFIVKVRPARARAKAKAKEKAESKPKVKSMKAKPAKQRSRLRSRPPSWPRRSTTSMVNCGKAKRKRKAMVKKLMT